MQVSPYRRYGQVARTYGGPILKAGSYAAGARAIYNAPSWIPNAVRYGYRVARNAYARYKPSGLSTSGGQIVVAPKRKLRLRKKQSLRAKVNKIAKHISSEESTLIYKKRSVDRLIVGAVNEAVATSETGLDNTYIETVIAGLRYFDPTTPGTYITANMTSGTQSKSVNMKAYSRIECQNNYVVPVTVDLYLVVPKRDTNISSITSVQNGLTDVGISTTTSNILCYPNDSPQFMALYNIKKHKRCVLGPGKKCFMNHDTGFFNYDPSIVDSQTENYQPRYKAHSYLIRLHGPMAHDSSLDQQGFQKGGIDYCCDSIVTCRYDGGAHFKYIITSDNSVAFTNTPHTSAPSDFTQENYAI